MSTDIEKLVAKMETARSRLDAALEKLSPQVEIYPQWKLKQLMDHITGWDELVLGSLHAFAHGESAEKLPPGGMNQFNAMSVRHHQELSLEESRLAFMHTRQAVIQALREFPAERLDERFPAPWGGECTITSVVKIFTSHDQEHAEHLEALLGGSANP